MISRLKWPNDFTVEPSTRVSPGSDFAHCIAMVTRNVLQCMQHMTVRSQAFDSRKNELHSNSTGHERFLRGSSKPDFQPGPCSLGPLRRVCIVVFAIACTRRPKVRRSWWWHQQVFGILCVEANFQHLRSCEIGWSVGSVRTTTILYVGTFVTAPTCKLGNRPWGSWSFQGRCCDPCSCPSRKIAVLGRGSTRGTQ